MQHVQAREFPSRRLRKRTPDDDQVAFRDKCNELRLRAEEQEALHPVSFAIGNSWNATLRSDKQHYLEYTTRRMTERSPPLCLFLPPCFCLPAFHLLFGFVPRACFPWVPVDVLPSPALWLCGSVLHAPFQIHPLSDTPGWLCSPRLWGDSCSAFCSGPFLCVVAVCLSVLVWVPLLCTYRLSVFCMPRFCTWALCCVFVVLWSPPSLPPSVVSVWRPGPVNF